MNINKETILNMSTMEIAKNPKLYKPYVMASLEGKTIDSLIFHGNGVWLSQLCHWAGISESGSMQKKAERLLKWYEIQNQM